MEFILRPAVHLRAFFLALGLSAAAGWSEEPALALPFSARETSGEKTITIRHKVNWDRTAEKLSWENLEARLSDDVSLRALPASIDLNGEAPRRLELRLEVKGGSIEADPSMDRDRTWQTPVRVRLAPRDFQWNDPRIVGRGIAFEADALLDSRLTEPPLEFLERLDLRHLRFDQLEAGPYRVADLSASGSWSRPNWELKALSAKVYEGTIELSGHGSWGTEEPPRVSLIAEGHGIALTPLLRAFDFPRAEQIQAKIGGGLRLEAEGRSWKVMDLQLIAEEGTPYLDRRLLREIFSFSGQDELLKKVEQALNVNFGAAKMIPFEELTLVGALSADELNLRLLGKSKALDLDVENNVDRVILWDLYDYLLDSGIEKIRNQGVKLQGGASATPPKQP